MRWIRGDQAAALRRDGRAAGCCMSPRSRIRRSSFVDPAKRAIVGQLPTGSRNTHFFALSGDEQRIYTSNVGDRTLSVIDVPGRRLLATVDAGASSQRMTLSPDGRWFVTSLWQSAQDRLLSHGGRCSWISPWTSTARPSSRASVRMAAISTTWAWSPMRSRLASACGRSTPPRAQVVAQSSEHLGVGTGGMQVNPRERSAVSHRLQRAGVGAGSAIAALVRQFPAADTPDGIFFSGRR